MENSEMRKEVERLENLLDGRRIGKKTLLKLGLAALLAFLPVFPVKAYMNHVQSVHQKQARDEIEQIKQESIERIFDMDQHKKYAEEIKRVTRDTGVPEYILKAMIDQQKYDFENVMNAGQGWIRDSVTDVAARNVGIRFEVLEKDPEMALRAAAKSYKECLEVCGNEEEALIRYGCINQTYEIDWKERIRKAKQEAKEAQKFHERYLQIRNNPRYAELVRLAEQACKVDEMVDDLPTAPARQDEWLYGFFDLREKYKQAELCQKIKGIAEKEFGRDPFRPYFTLKNDYKKNRWWVNAAPYGDLVKRALKFKRSSQKKR